MITHYNNQPMIDIYASVEGRDLGGVDSDIQKVLNIYQDNCPAGRNWCAPDKWPR